MVSRYGSRPDALLGVALLLAAAGCALTPSSETPIDRTTLAQTDFFEVEVPHGKGWKVDVRPREGIVRCIGAVRRGLAAEISVMRNRVGRGAEYADPEYVAKDFRGREIRGMEMLGVAPGLFELSGVEQGQLQEAGKLYYWLTFTQRFHRKDLAVDGVLYLLFPPDFATNRNFHLVLFKTFRRRDSRERAFSDEDRRRVLRSLQPITKIVETGAGSDLSRDKVRKLAGVSPYSRERRWETYVVIRDLSWRLKQRSPAQIEVLHTGRSDTFSGPEIAARTAGGYPRLVLEDRDNDGSAEFYVYLPERGPERTQEFGAFFDLSGDARPDWIVFNGGPIPTKEGDWLWYTHQAVDTNGDGRLDVRIYNSIDMDGDSLPEKEATAWVYDDDGDGLVDRAEHIVDGRAQRIVPEHGMLQLRCTIRPEPADQPRIGGPLGTETLQEVADDIASLMDG